MAKRVSISYKDAGVDIAKGNLFIKDIRPLVGSTMKKPARMDIGFFAGLFNLAPHRYKEPVLVASTDGVGTKLIIAQQFNLHKTIGIDLVAMCANDVATTGASPLFFLDYISTGRLDPKVLKDVVSGIAYACRKTGYALIGGETAEMPDIYNPGEYDLAGFCVGVAEKKDLINGRRVKKGDILLGLESSGLHSNGYSLVRKVFSKKELKGLRPELLKPTRLYVWALAELRKRVDIKGIAHITGGAYQDKISRIIPKRYTAEIKKGSWPAPKIFDLIQRAGNVEEAEMYKVFNMGIGMLVVVPPEEARRARGVLKKLKLKSWIIGSIIKGSGGVRLI